MATLTDSLSNGLKSLFSGLGAKTTDSNYAVPLVNKSTASPTGYMEMKDLAVQMQNSLATTLPANGGGSYHPNIDELLSVCRIRTLDANSTKALGGTLPFTGGGIELQVDECANRWMQTAYDQNTAGVFYKRFYSKANNTWGPWFVYSGTLVQP